jgi:hypothetical protein
VNKSIKSVSKIKSQGSSKAATLAAPSRKRHRQGARTIGFDVGDRLSLVCVLTDDGGVSVEILAASRLARHSLRHADGFRLVGRGWSSASSAARTHGIPGSGAVVERLNVLIKFVPKTAVASDGGGGLSPCSHRW